MNVFETNRERITIEKVNPENEYFDKRAHVFALCVTSDNVPVIGVRRTSFMYQSIISKRRKLTDILTVNIKHLKYMYTNEIKEICIRSITPFTFCEYQKNSFEELVLLGGKIKTNESIYQCLLRELSEESDDLITITDFGTKAVKLIIEDKILSKTFYCYCVMCYIKQSYADITKPLYNIEIKSLVSLLSKRKNEKFEYLNYIYNALL